MLSSTWKNRNIFEDILSREDPLTDALRNFLKYRPVRDALWRTLPKTRQESVNFSLIEDIQTRSSGGHSEGTPDLVLYGSDFILVIEVKIGAKLTDAQQEAYVPWIRRAIQESQTQKGFVVFLIPDNYPYRVQLDSCLEEARESCRSDNSNIQVLDPITWQKFVKELESQDMPSLNEIIREFYDHLSERFKPVRFFTEEVNLMHSKETASGILKLMDMVEKVKDNLDSSEVPRTGLYRGYGYAYNFISSEKVHFYFGIWWQFWAEHGLPLCVAIKQTENNQSIQAFRKQYGTRVLLFEGWLVFGYNLPESEPDTDCNALIDKIVRDIEALLRKDSSESSEDAETL